MGVNLVFFYCLIQDEYKEEGFEDPTDDPPAVVFHLPGNSDIRSADAKLCLQISSSV